MVELTYINKRREPRFLTEIPAVIVSGEITADASIINISQHGLRIVCAHHLLTELMPNIAKPNSNDLVDINIQFQVETTRRQLSDIDLICSVIYVRRSTQENYILGCAFKEFSNNSDIDLSNFIQNFTTDFVD